MSLEKIGSMHFEEARAMYVSGLSMQAVANRADCSLSHVHKWFKLGGVMRRKPSDYDHTADVRTLTERLLRRIEKKPSGCWEWQGARGRSGHGVVNWSGTDDRLVHRIAYTLLVGAIPEGLFVCHHCDNPPCMNPAHLYAGTAKDNVGDMFRRGRTRPNPLKGSEHALSKLDERSVRLIHARACLGENYLSIAQDFNVSASTVGDIRRGKTWRHATGQERITRRSLEDA